MPCVLKPNQILTVAFFLLLSLPLLAVDYYWIGGSGNWGDLTHWATASGNGTVLHNKTPGSGDDVYIDANSLNGLTDTIVMNVQTSFCRSLSIKNIGGNLTLIFTSGKFLRVFGNIDIDDFEIIGGGTISCESPITGRTIATHFRHIPNLEFNSVVGGWALLDSLNAGNITKNSGSLKSNQNYIQCAGFAVYAGATNLDTAQIQCTYFNINGGGFSFKLGRLDVNSNANISNVSSISTDGTSVYHTGSYFFDYAAPNHQFDSIFFLNLTVQFPHLNAGASMTAKHVQFYHVPYGKQQFQMGSGRANYR